MQSYILKAATRLLVGLILVFSVYLLFRGHNAPGGGFSAALVAATAFALFAIAEGPGPVYQALRIEPRVLIAWGLLLAVCSGLIAVVTGRPYLTGLWCTPPGFHGALAVGTPLFFDIGVFLVVLGTILTLLLNLEEG
jgi:multisubunit Na+/H+ antiporter MnhB subunit